MASSKVSMCNGALTKIGESTITSLTDNSARASVCSERYDDILEEVLRDHPWNFALKRQTLVELSADPPFGYDKQFQLPNDCLRIISINDSEAGLSGDYVYGFGSLTNIPFSYAPVYAVEDRVILTNEGKVDLLYVAKIEDATKYDSLFKNAFQYRLAAEIAPRLTGSIAYHEKMLQLYQAALLQARTKDAQEGTPRNLYNDLFVEFSRR